MDDYIVALPDAALYHLFSFLSFSEVAQLERAYGFDRPDVFLTYRKQSCAALQIPVVSFNVLDEISTKEPYPHLYIDILIRDVDDTRVDYADYILQYKDEIDIDEIYTYALEQGRERVAYAILTTFNDGCMTWASSEAICKSKRCFNYCLQKETFINLIAGWNVYEAGIEDKEIIWIAKRVCESTEVTPMLVHSYLFLGYYINRTVLSLFLSKLTKEEVEIAYRKHMTALAEDKFIYLDLPECNVNELTDVFLEYR